jgi:hypothetical protein
MSDADHAAGSGCGGRCRARTYGLLGDRHMLQSLPPWEGNTKMH